MGNNELQMFVLGIMAARNLKPMDLHRLTGISRRTLTEITKGRYNLGSERTRETLEKLADGLRIDRAEVLEVAGLDPTPAPSSVPEEILSRALEAQRMLAEQLDALRAALEASGRPVPPVPQPPTPPPGPRTPRKRPPRNGPPNTPRKGSQGS